MYANKLSTDRTDMDTAERHRRTYPQQTSRCDVTTPQRRLSLVNLSQDALSSFVKIHPFFRQCQAACAARNQARTSPALQRRETLADHAERQVHFPSGRGKASRRHDADEGPQFVDVIEHEGFLDMRTLLGISRSIGNLVGATAALAATTTTPKAPLSQLPIEKGTG